MKCYAAALSASTSVLLLLLCSAGCESEPAEPPPTVRPGEPSLPPDLVVPPGSELERRLEGTCIPFDPWQDGSGQTVCVMSTPQDGTLGRLTAEGEDEIARADGVGGVSEPLLDPVHRAGFPAAVDHRAEYLDGCVSVSHQLECGWCLVHAATALLEALHCSKGCDAPELSESHLRSISRDGRDFGSCATGWNMEAAMRTLVEAPIAPEATWPYRSGGRSLNEARPPQGELDMAATFQATGFDSIEATNIGNVKAALASGREVMMSIPIFRNNGGTPARTDWLSSTATVREVDTRLPCGCAVSGCSDPVCLKGYHAVVLTGYDDATQEFSFLNSWGKGWGDGGYGRMSYEFVRERGMAAHALRDVRTDVPGATCSDTSDAGVDAEADSGGRDAGDAGDGGSGSAMVSACASISDCGGCVRRSGCGWCDDVGCRDDSYVSTCPGLRETTCGLIADSCARSGASCGTCLAADGCEWCHDGRICYDPARRSIHCGAPANAIDQCPACGATNCGTCTAMDGCGWCPGHDTDPRAGEPPDDCVHGSATAPDRGSCSFYRTSDAMCSGDPCRDFGDCARCLSVPGCGWCDGVGQCMAGDFSGPVAGGEGCAEDWDYYAPFCDNTDDSCGSATSCRQCLWNTSLGCGWDEAAASCAEATASGTPGVTQSLEECPGSCNEEGSGCGEECCEGLTCVIGRCADCTGKLAVTETCDPTVVGPCCGGLTCSNAVGGGSTCCTSAAEPCTEDAECCGEMRCVLGQCVCRYAGQPCLSSRECCGGSLCTDGACS